VLLQVITSPLPFPLASLTELQNLKSVFSDPPQVTKAEKRGNAVLGSWLLLPLPIHRDTLILLLGSTSIRFTLHRINSEIKLLFGWKDLEIAGDFKGLKEQFKTLLTRIGETSAKLVLIIDALNQLDSENGALGLGTIGLRF
jgi:hypothetical protein